MEQEGHVIIKEGFADALRNEVQTTRIDKRKSNGLLWKN